MGQMDDKPGAAGADRVPERDGPAIGIHAIVVLPLPCLEAGQRLGGKRLVQFDCVKIIQCASGTLAEFLRGMNRSESHPLWIAADLHPGRENTKRLPAVPASRLLAAEDQHGRAVVDA